MDRDSYAGRRYLACLRDLRPAEQALAIALWRKDPYAEDDAQWTPPPERVLDAVGCLGAVEDDVGREREFARWSVE